MFSMMTPCLLRIGSQSRSRFRAFQKPEATGRHRGARTPAFLRGRSGYVVFEVLLVEVTDCCKHKLCVCRDDI